MADRREVLAYADRHGAKAAGEHFHIPAGTVRSWRSRARKRGTAPPTPAERWLAEARQLAERYTKRQCLQCGGVGTVDVPATARGSLTIRPARRIPCPTYGGPVRHIQVTEWPRAEWIEGMRVAGDLGAGWTAEQWGRVRAGEDPDGYRFADGDRLEPGEGRP
jgi:hypothetical protein